jgi:hypothetical protein
MKFSDSNYGNSCDGCGRRGIKAPECVWRCDKCDYDLCQKCYDKAPPPADSFGTLQVPSAPPADNGYHQATAPPAPTGFVPIDEKVLEKCSWFFAEALRFEREAAEKDRAGKTTEAIFHYRRALTKLQEGLDVCPAGHPDKPAFEEFSSSMQLRIVYLESLGGAPATTPVEEHIEDVIPTLDVSNAKPPEETSVSSLIASTGVSGSTADLSEEGYQLVAALKKNEEMKTFMNRILVGHGVPRKVQAGAEANFEALVPEFSGEKQVQSFAILKGALLNAPWIELFLDPQRDKLELAMDLQREGERFELEGLPLRAAEMYNKAAMIIEFVLKRDERMKIAKVKDMVTARAQALKDKQMNIEAQEAAKLMGSLG